MSAAKISRKQYRNWVRGALGLNFLQDGLHPFTDRVVKVEHARVVQNLKPCSGCAICRSTQKKKCDCKQKTAKTKCATCNTIYDEIVKSNRLKYPHWVSECSDWFNDHWQFAKCFMTTTTKESNKTAADTDASGLLSIIINGEFFESELDCSIDTKKHTDIFSQVRNIRNEILHNAKQELTDNEVTQYLESMIAVLEDKKALSSDQAAQAAASKLKEILKDELNITLSKEAKVIQTELDAIKENIRTLEQQKENFSEEILNNVKEEYEPKIQRLEDGLAGHENRIKLLEDGQQDVEKRVRILEIEKLKTTEDNLQKRKDKLDLQEHLMKEYQKKKVKTSISPLMKQKDNINIREVYVSPRMVVEENKADKDKNTAEAGKDRGTNNKDIEIGDLFGTDEKRNRKIFIVGDVGTGKSSFCKMMMQQWCSSMTKENDAYGINQFDFLFYVPLCEITKGIDDIVDMIKSQLHTMYWGLVDGIFTKESERILILADGLDEWKPRESNRHGIPKSSSAGDSTILTTSRPSSRGILNMELSDCDLKVTLLGLKDKKSMIQKYMKKLDTQCTESDVAAFNNALSCLPFKDIKNAPMLLQQIIWLHCNNYDIGQSRTSVYLHIVNAILGWEYERTKAYSKLQSSRFEQHSLPKRFDKYNRCHENQELLLLLGKIAYAAYITGDDSSLVFGRHKLRQLSVSDEDIDTIVQTGILTEFNSADPTYEKSQLSFIHTSYVEFFAALYICSSYLSESSDSHSSVTPLTILEGLIAVTPETSVTEILRLENVLIMICGLAPGLTEHVCECIYKLTPSGENTDENNHRQVKRQIQELTSDCLSEHNSVDQETAVKCKLRHLYHDSYSRRLFVRVSDLVPTSVETCSLNMFYHSLSHEECLSLISFLSQTVSLRTLKIHRIECSKDECEGHTIDLTNHKELQSVKLSNSKIFLSGINHTCLQSCKIWECELSHEQCSLLSTCLSQAMSLQTVRIDNIYSPEDECEGHTIDLTNHKELQSVELLTGKFSVSGINHTCLKSCKLWECKLSHEQCSLLSLCLSQAVSLRTLEIYWIKCPKYECEGHTIYLTNHKELKSVNLKRSKISVSGINHTSLTSCKISFCVLSHEQCSLLLSFLSQAVSLKTLEINYIECAKNTLRGQIKCIGDVCEGHYIHLTNHKQLWELSVSDCNKITITGINPTCKTRCYIDHCSLSHEQCASLCTFLSKSINLRSIKLTAVKCTLENCKGHSIDLTNHQQLCELSISDCNKITITDINPTCPEECYIRNCFLSHEQCASLCTFLSKSIKLCSIELTAVKCTKDKCEGHFIDLTNHKKLYELRVSGCYTISITGINPTCPEVCDISNCSLLHEQCASLCTFLSKSINLRSIKLTVVKCTKQNCEGHFIDNSNNKLDLSIRECVNVFDGRSSE